MIITTYSNKEKLINFIESINNDFSPQLSQKVNLLEFVEKIILKSILIVEIDEEQIKGLIVLYCNDEVEKKAYVSLCAVDKRFRGKGIATDLLVNAISIVTKKSYKTIGIHSNNNIAIKMYQKHGFEIISTEFKQDKQRNYLELKIK